MYDDNPRIPKWLSQNGIAKKPTYILPCIFVPVVDTLVAGEATGPTTRKGGMQLAVSSSLLTVGGKIMVFIFRRF